MEKRLRRGQPAAHLIHVISRYSESPPKAPAPRYRWPWFVLAAVILGILLAIFWVSREVERTRQLRQWNQQVPGGA